jgi:hypothetical protein
MRGRESCDQKLSERKERQHENRNKPGNPYKHKATPADADGKRNENFGDNVFVVGLIAAEGNSCWIIDSGASQHMTANRDLVVNYGEFPEPEPVAVGDMMVVLLMRTDMDK